MEATGGGGGAVQTNVPVVAGLDQLNPAELPEKIDAAYELPGIVGKKADVAELYT